MTTMTPSAAPSMTDGQIDKAVATYRAMLTKHRSELGSDAVQHALGQPEYVAAQVAVLRERVEAVSDLIVRHVVVNRTRTPMEAINATGRTKYCNDDVVASMPQGEGDEADVIFFKLGRDISNADLDREYDLRDLKPADPYSLAAVNEADPAFADERPNGTQWKDADGKYCYAAFGRWLDGERCVDVFRSDNDWNDSWCFAGVRK
ncbi:MAG: hypothetical protein ACHQU0_02050 [Candidatus Paceibacteria bacterium]